MTEIGLTEPTENSLEEMDFSWTDARRGRDISALIRLPDSARPAPVIIFSHGLGFTRRDYAYLGRAWAQAGLIPVFVQHPGSDDSIWSKGPGGLKSLLLAASDPANILGRPPDLSFVLDRLTELNNPGRRLAGRLDLARIGAAGHSMGAMTALTLAGVGAGDGRGLVRNFTDRRIRAVAAMSSRARRGKPGLDLDFSGVGVPVLHITGTEDYSPAGEITPADRRAAFRRISGVDQYLIIIDGGDHSTFLGEPERKNAHPLELDHHRLIIRSTTDFFRHRLGGNEQAGAGLADTGRLKGLAELRLKTAG